MDRTAKVVAEDRDSPVISIPERGAGLEKRERKNEGNIARTLGSVKRGKQDEGKSDGLSELAGIPMPAFM